MRTLNLKGGKVQIWESCKELPARRWNDFQKYLIQQIGIGSDIADVERHHNNLFQFLAAGKIQEAQNESFNLFQNIVYTIKNINIQHIAFGCFIYSIKGKPISDYSEANLIAVIDKLSDMGLTQGHVEDILDDVKKKLILN